jgi:hypothetical protein
MPLKAKYLFVASMDVDADKEALFNEVYDTEHVPYILKVPGVHGASRLTAEGFTVVIGGVSTEKPAPSPRYHALYEIDSPAVLLSKEWAAAAEAGRWPSQVRPYTRNRAHALYKLL